MKQYAIASLLLVESNWASICPRQHGFARSKRYLSEL